MSKFKVGDKVVPSYDEEYGGYHNYLVEGEVYTVTSVQYDLIDIDGAMSPLAVGYGKSCKFDWSEDWFKLADEQLLSNAFDKAVEEVGETFVANSLIERETEMNAEQIRDEILRINARIEEAKKDIENAEKERNSLVEKLREKGLRLWGVDSVPKNIEYLDEVVVGETYMVTNNFGQAENYFVGKKVIVERIDERAHSLFIYAKTECGEYGDWMHYQDLAKI